MSQLLDRAFERRGRCRNADQDAIAALILDEIEDDRRWDEAFARSPSKLAALADMEEAMSPTMKALGIDRLSPDQRAALALEIWESLGDDRPAGHLSPAQRAELWRRNAEMDANPGSALTWEQIRASVEDGQ